MSSMRLDGSMVALERQETLNPTKASNRRCRDVLFLLLFIAFNLGTFYLCKLASDTGDLDRIRYGISSNDQVCGQGAHGNITSSEGRKYLLYCAQGYAGNTEFGLYSYDTKKVCVSECPTDPLDIQRMWDDDTTMFREELTTAWAMDVSNTNPDGIPYEWDDAVLGCMSYTKPLFYRCFIDYTTIANSTLAQDFADDWNISQYINDMQQTWVVILACGVGVAFVGAWLMLMVMKFLAGILVWISVGLFNVLMICMALYTAFKAGLISDQDLYGTGAQTNIEATNEEYMTYLCYFCIGLAVLVFLLTLFFRKRINLAIGIMKEAADVMREIPLIVFIPVPAWTGTAVMTCAYVLISCWVYSTGEIENGELKLNKTMEKMLIYVLAWYLWVIFFIDAICNTTTAGAVASWYWARDKKTVRLPILQAARRTFRFHLGSMAFGSFLMMTIRLIRILFEFYTRQMKKMKENKCVKILLCITRYCLWYVEKVIRFLNRNAYIMIAIFGEAFCPSAKNAFMALASNAARFIAVSVVSSFIVFLATMITVCLACLACYAYLESDQFDPEGEKAVSSPLFPVLITGLAAYLVSKNFFSIYDMTIDTLFMSFTKDEEMNKGTGKFYATKRLQGFMHKSFRKGKKGKKDANAAVGAL